MATERAMSGTTAVRRARAAASERLPQRMRDDPVRAITATHREKLHRTNVELRDLETNEDARRERVRDDVLGKPAPAHPGQDHVPLRRDVGHAPAHSAFEHVER